MMWKIFTAQVREESYYSLTSRGLFHEEYQGCPKRSKIKDVNILYLREHDTIMARQEFKLAYYYVAVKHVIHYGIIWNNFLKRFFLV